jgi:hypothetical protein
LRVGVLVFLDQLLDLGHVLIVHLLAGGIGGGIDIADLSVDTILFLLHGVDRVAAIRVIVG